MNCYNPYCLKLIFSFSIYKYMLHLNFCMFIDDNMNYSFIFLFAFFLVQIIGETTGESKYVGAPELFLGNKWFTVMKCACTDE
jgi:hypothetical protein